MLPSLRQYAAMAYIYTHGSATWSELLQFYGSESALSRSLKSMINRGWVKKTKRRRYELTDLGVMVLIHARQVYAFIHTL